MSEEQENLDDLVDQWHNQSTDVPLHQYLGMTWGEYKTWVETCQVPSDWSPPSY